MNWHAFWFKAVWHLVSLRWTSAKSQRIHCGIAKGAEQLHSLQSLKPCGSKPPELSWGQFQKLGQVSNVGSPIEHLPRKLLWQGHGATNRARWELRIRPAHV